MYSALCYSHNLRRALQPNLLVFASLYGPSDVTKVKFRSIQYLLCMLGSGATKLCFHHCVPKVGIGEFKLMYRSLAFRFSLCYEIFGVDRVLGDRDSLATNGKALKLCQNVRVKGMLLTIRALRIGDRSVSESESSMSDISSNRSEADNNCCGASEGEAQGVLSS